MNYNTLKSDAVSGLVVFLVAIPLCLGIALASGAPLFSGLIAGIVGGIVVGSLSDSHVSVSGPAAGMVAVVVAAITHLDNFNVFLLAVFISGIFQIALGYVKAGFFADYIPSNVIQGLLSAIGILIIIKQLPLAFTYAENIDELKFLLLDTTHTFSLQPLQNLLQHINYGAVVITCVSFAIMIFADKTSIEAVKKIPSTIVVVIVAVILNEIFEVNQMFLTQNTPHLVDIPIYSSGKDFLHQMEFPAWQAWFNPNVYYYALVIAIVGSLESLINVKASERLDKKRRYCCKDRELVAQGVGNMVSGLFGGLPITSVIVRSSVNAENGAQTKKSTIFHGIFLLVASIFLPSILNQIPLAALASILIYIGYKLASPKIFKEIYKQGNERFIIFLITVISIVLLNLMIGVLIGLAVSTFTILQKNSQVRLDIMNELHPSGFFKKIILPQQITFLNKASLVSELESIEQESKVIIDASQSDFIDNEIVNLINEFKNDIAPHKNIALNLIGFKDHYDIHDHIDFISVTTYDAQSSLTPLNVLRILKEGNERFISNTRIHRFSLLDIEHTSDAQHPIAVVVGCIDSRVPIETIFDMGFGDIFCVRIAGNVINSDIIASIEFACNISGAKLIVVLGHTNCGAIKAACDSVEFGRVTELLNKIKVVVDAEDSIQQDRSSKNQQFVSEVTHLNIGNSIREIYHASEALQEAIDSQEVGIVGAIYDVNTGKVAFENYSTEIQKVSHKSSHNLSTDKLIENHIKLASEALD